MCTIFHVIDLFFLWKNLYIKVLRVSQILFVKVDEQWSETCCAESYVMFFQLLWKISKIKVCLLGIPENWKNKKAPFGHKHYTQRLVIGQSRTQIFQNGVVSQISSGIFSLAIYISWLRSRCYRYTVLIFCPKTMHHTSSLMSFCKAVLGQFFCCTAEYPDNN